MASKARSIANFKIFSNNIANGAISFNNIGNIFTSNIIESGSALTGNIYFSNTRARNAFLAGPNITIDYNTGTITAAGGGSVDLSTYAGNITGGNVIITGKYYGDGSALTGVTATVTGLSTSNVAEGSNLYFTNSRAALAAIPATTQLVLTTPVFNYNLDQYSGDNPTIYVTAGETISFELNQSSSHPFAIRVSNGGSNYDTGLTHVDDDGTVSTGSGAQGKYSGKLFWKIPYSLAGNTYVYQCTVHSSMVGNIVIQSPIGTSVLAGLTTSSIAEGTNLYYTNSRVYSNVTSLLTNYPGNITANNITVTGKFFGDGSALTGITSTVSGLSTSNISEGSNLYYTNARVYSNVISLLPGYTGNITANTITVTGRFVGDGSGLTNLSTPSATSNLAALPTYNGNALISNLVVSGNLSLGGSITGNITTGNLVLFSTGNVVIDTGPFETRFFNNGNVSFPGNITATRLLSDAVTLSGNVNLGNILVVNGNASIGNIFVLGKIFGDGSALTGITSTGGAADLNSLATYNGNALISNLVVSGNLTVGGNLIATTGARLTLTGDANTTIRAGDFRYIFGDTGYAIFPNVLLTSGGLFTSAGSTANSIISAGNYDFTFADTGNFYAPNIYGNVYGDGSGITGILTTSALRTYNGNLLAANLTANTIFADFIYASNIIDGLGSTVITLTADTNTTIRHGVFESRFTNQGNVFLPNVIASKFFGDGSGITNISASASLGALATYNGNALLSNLVVSGNATFQANINLPGLASLSSTNSNNTTIRAGIYRYTFGDTGDLLLPGNLLSSSNSSAVYTGFLGALDSSNTIISAGGSDYVFSGSGVVLPNVTVTGNIFASNINTSSGSSIRSTNDSNTTIRAGIYSYVFTDTGTLSLPGNITLPSAGTLSSTTDSNTTISAGNFDFLFDNTGEFRSTNIFATSGIFIANDTNTNAYISNASRGAATTTLYIGNQSITTTSDIRLKENITNTSLQAINIVNNLRVVDFTWNDPTDLAFNNKNARGKWTGLIAQETINHLPFVVNAVRDSDTLDPIPDAKDNTGKNLYWGIEYDKIVPVLIKAVQEQQTLIEELKSRIQTLEQINN